METKIPNPDPRGEYKKICPYCFDLFIADNMNRIYCPVKTGIPEYCKNRMVRIRRNEEKTEEEKKLNTNITPMNKDTLVSIEIGKNEIANQKLNRNIYLIEFYLKNNESVEVDIDLLLKHGFDLDSFSSRQQILETKEYIAQYGNYGSTWYNENTLLLTHQKHLLWTTSLK